MPHQPDTVDQSDRVVPINLRQSGRTPVELLISTRVRKSPYWHLSHEAGCWRATIYNRIYHPRGYVRPEDGGAAAEHRNLPTILGHEAHGFREVFPEGRIHRPNPYPLR